jgi:hypothetical protein
LNYLFRLEFQNSEEYFWSYFGRGIAVKKFPKPSCINDSFIL